MSNISASIVVVSRGRPDALRRCLAGIEQLYCPDFEVVVVADPAGIGAVQDMGFAAVKLVPFDEPNISAARNIGIADASGEVIAFIDDDAVPEPTWLDNLVAPFKDANVAAAAGFVRGRNGITFQSKASWVDAEDGHVPIDVGTQPVVLKPKPGKAIKTPGTNCAFRRSVLLDCGGFDPVFRFFLDETDLNLRLAEQGLATAIVPLAEVHHGFHASAYRTAERMPLSLFEIGASQAAFLRKHAKPDRLEPVLSLFRAEQRARMMRHLVTGAAEPRDVRDVLASLDQGIDAGKARSFGQRTSFGPLKPHLRFVPRTKFTDAITLIGRRFDRASLQKRAQDALANGQRVSVFEFSRTALYHCVTFEGGAWVQHGGLFGKSDRSDPRWKFWQLKRRTVKELARISSVRMPSALN